jgi:hypothetical protein
MSFALLRAAGLAAAAVIALPGGGWAQQPYQSQSAGPYTHSVRGEGVPVVYMASDAFAPRVENNLRVALWSIRDCDRQSFKESISNLSALEKQLGDYGESLVASDPQQARVWINDANTVASLINWLLAKSWSHCKPPSKPIPVPQGRAAFYEITRFGGGSVSGTPLGREAREPPPSPPPPPPESPVRPQDQVMMGPGPIFPGAQPFVGVNFSGDFQTTNFTFSDTGFNVNGSGVMGGGFAGVLLPIPNTNALAGFRVGGQGGNITGDIKMPASSPTFNYTVKTDATLYQEAVVSIPASSITSFLLNVAYDVPLAPKWDFAFGASVGVAESHTSVNGTAGAFSVTDSGWRPGITFTAGVAKPVAILANGGVVDLFVQYRGTQFISTVNVPGGVNIGSFTNEVDGGITVHFGGGVSWTLR